MKIKITDSYVFWDNAGTYTIENTYATLPTINYNVNIVENNIETAEIAATDILPGETGTFTLSTEGIYKLYIYVTTGQTPVLTTYDIRYFPTLKANIIAILQKGIYDCSNLDDQVSCGTKASAPNAQNLYETQLLFNSANLYRDLLLSPSFLRNYTSSFMFTLSKKNTTLFTIVGDTYSILDNTGFNMNSTHGLRYYLSYLYILFYIIEIDYVLYDTDIPRGTTEKLYPVTLPVADSAEITAVKTLFNFENLKMCFIRLNIDPVAIHNEMYYNYINESIDITIP